LVERSHSLLTKLLSDKQCGRQLLFITYKHFTTNEEEDGSNTSLKVRAERLGLLAREELKDNATTLLRVVLVMLPPFA
jgi:hypothetical protein